MVTSYGLVDKWNLSPTAPGRGHDTGGLWGKIRDYRYEQSRGPNLFQPKQNWSGSGGWGDPRTQGKDFNLDYGTNPTRFWDKIYSSMGYDKNTPFGSMIRRTIDPTQMEAVFSLFSPDGGGNDGHGGPASHAGFQQSFVNWARGMNSDFHADYKTIGEALHDAFANDNTQFATALMDVSDNPDAQAGLIEDIIDGLGRFTMTSTQLGAVKARLGRVLDQYYREGWGRNENDLTFVQYLVQNAALFLDRYWKGHNWTAMAPPKEGGYSDAADGTAEMHSAADGGGGAGGHVTTAQDSAGSAIRTAPATIKRGAQAVGDVAKYAGIAGLAAMPFAGPPLAAFAAGREFRNQRNDRKERNRRNAHTRW